MSLPSIKTINEIKSICETMDRRASSIDRLIISEKMHKEKLPLFIVTGYEGERREYKASNQAISLESDPSFLFNRVRSQKLELCFTSSAVDRIITALYVDFAKERDRIIENYEKQLKNTNKTID